MKAPILTLLTLWLLASPAFATPSDTELNLAVTDQHIIPAYQTLANQTKSLRAKADTFCAAPAPSTFQPLHSAFKDALNAYQGVQHIRFGPIKFLLREHRYQLWPDKRSTVSKHLARLLAAKDPGALEPESFAQGSVAVQGFSALERLLFGKAQLSDFSGDAGVYRCQVLRAIAGNLADMSANLLLDWSAGAEPHRQLIATAEDGNLYYEEAGEISANLLNNLYTQLQFIVDSKLDRPLGKTIAKARGKRAEAWRSERSLANIQANLLACRTLYRLGFAPRLAGGELNQRIEQAFAKTLAQVEAIDMPLAQAVQDEKTRAQVSTLRASASELKTLIGRDLAAATEIPIGFNSLDGD